MNEAKKPDDRPEWVKSLGLFGIILSDLLGFIGLGIGLGYLAMKKGWAKDWAPAVGGFVGLAIAIWRMVERVKKNED